MLSIFNPFAGPNAVEAVAWAAHPLYPTASFVVHDVGVVTLQAPDVVVPSNRYGLLPTVNQFDSLSTRRGQKDVTSTAVGYGLQESFPTPPSFLASNSRTRYVATPRLLQINVPGFTGDFAMLLSNMVEEIRLTPHEGVLSIEGKSCGDVGGCKPDS